MKGISSDGRITVRLRRKVRKFMEGKNRPVVYINELIEADMERTNVR